jgi:hypothetical protein
MATKQGAFRKTSGQMTSWAFTNPGFVPRGKTKSLRMRIFSLKYYNKPLFHGLTPENRGTGQVFTFHKNYEEFACMMIMGMYVYVEHLDPGHGRYWFNAKAIELAEGAYWDAQKGVIVSPQDQALSEAVAKEWGETDELVNDNGEEHTGPDNIEDLTPAITGNDGMLDHKFDDGKTMASVGNVFTPRMETHKIDAGTRPDSISAVSFGSENEKLQQELVAMQAKLKKMEAQMAAANQRSLKAASSMRHQMPKHLAAAVRNPLVTPPKTIVTGSADTTLSGVGADD